MFLEIMTATLIAANVQPGNYHPVKYEPAQVEFKVEKTLPEKTSVSNLQVNNLQVNNYTDKYRLPDKNKTKYKNYDEVIADYTDKVLFAIREVKRRYNQEGQFLKWITLPEAQLAIGQDGKSHLDAVYEQASELISRKDKEERPLVVLGIGGSKHTAEFLLNMTGLKHDRNIYFYSDIDPVSYDNFLKSTGYQLQDLNFLVVSKSGTTFETKDAFLRFENALVNYYKQTGLSEDAAIKKAQSHFAICTDSKATEKNLRGIIGAKNGQDNNYIKELYIHDDVGGRFSMFDDASLFVLAYAGVSKDKTKRILEAAKKATVANLSEDIKNNHGAKGAIFYGFSSAEKFFMKQQQYFGRIFEGAGENWAKQLYQESMKEIEFSVGKAPDSMHYATEAHFTTWNREKYCTIMTLMNPSISENYKRYVSSIENTYADMTPVKTEILEVEDDAIKPEAIGEYIQSKHFETVYSFIVKGLMWASANDISNRPVLDALIQPAVEIYKNDFKPGSPYALNPGK